MNIKITVITVCYNAEKTIENTIRSVLSQTYPYMEYLILDGASGDRTREIIENYLPDQRTRYFSEADSGLYNAMNKATDMAAGDYIIFMNSGDVFRDEKVLEDVAAELEKTPTAAIMYGNTERQFLNYSREEKYPGRHRVLMLLLMGRMMCHQSIFTKTSVMKEYRFDESYRITADYDFIVRAKKNHLQMKYIDRTISIVDCENGISSQKCSLEQMRAEDDRSLKRNMPVWYWAIWLPKRVYRIIKKE